MSSSMGYMKYKGSIKLFLSSRPTDVWKKGMWIVDCRHFIFNENYIHVSIPNARFTCHVMRKRDIWWLELKPLMVLLRGRNNRSHLGPATLSAAPDIQAHALHFNKSPRHHRQRSTAAQCLWKAALEVLPRRFVSLLNIPLRQVTHYANALFTVHVTISRHESQWGLGGLWQVTKRDRGRGREQTRWENSQRIVANGSYSLSVFVQLWVSRLRRDAKGSKHVSVRKRPSHSCTCDSVWEIWGHASGKI